MTPRDALRQVAEEEGENWQLSTTLAAIAEARERGGVPAVGATATIVGAIELATQLTARAEQLMIKAV